MKSSGRNALGRFAGFVCLLLVATFVLVLVGWIPTGKLAASGGKLAMAVGIALSLFGSLIGGLPVLLGEKLEGIVTTPYLLTSLAARFFIVAAGSVAVLLLGSVEMRPFVVWVGLSYIILLPFDITYAIRGSNPPLAESESSS